MGRKILYEKLKRSKMGVGVVDTHSPFLSLSWEDYLPWGFEEVVNKATQSSEDPWITRGFTICYSPYYDEFYLREWEQSPYKAEGKIINRIKVISEEDVIRLIKKGGN